MLARAISGHSKTCFLRHREREAFNACASSFCFDNCGQHEDCTEFCDEKTAEAFDFFSSRAKKPALLAVRSQTNRQGSRSQMTQEERLSSMMRNTRQAEIAVRTMLERNGSPEAGRTEDNVVSLLEKAEKFEAKVASSAPKMDRHHCRVLCQRFMFKKLGKAFEHIDHPNDCMPKCDEVYGTA